MKKSKFFKNSRDMLSRSFNPSNCKISLRLAGSRLKLLRNKKEVQLKQMKREISQLLESGQDQTARIRVEHVIREEKMMAAYDLIQIYCELIIARLPIIESQKLCPIDLKEAIATVVFASPRCGDVPELQDVRKHFTEKYGKDFTTAALELRPDCGVSRMLVEKLSAVAPDGQTKTKILSAIAEEHNVKWDPKSFDENSVPASDLLNGPSSFGKEHFEGPDVPVPKSNNKVDNSSYESSGINTSVQHEARPPGDEWAQIYQISSNTISPNGQRWNMDFKDAASAAQAAAESAELASMAARAAARLSSRGRQSSTESHNSDPNVLINEAYTSQESMNRSISGHTTSRNEEIDRMKSNNLKTDGRFNNTGHTSTEKYSQSASLKSKASMGNESLDHGVSVVEGYSRDNSLKDVSRGEVSTTQRQSFKAQSENVWQEKSESVRGERVRSSHSHSSISDGVNIFANSEDPNFEYGAVEDSFSGFGKKGIDEEASQTDSRESAAAVFDESDSDSENHTFGMNPPYDEPKQGFHLPLSGQKSHDHFSTNTDSWSPRSSTSKTEESPSSLFLNRKSDFSERSVDGPKPDDSNAVTFDESDASSSASEEDINRSIHSSISRDTLSKQNQPSGLNRKQLLPSFDDGLKSRHTDRERKQGKKFDTGSSGPESDGGLNFGRLTGGFRQRGYNPPYLKKQSDVSSSFNKKSRVLYSDSSEGEESLRKSSDHKKNIYTPYVAEENAKIKPTIAAQNPNFGSDNSDTDEDFPKQSSSHLHSEISQRTKAFPSSSGKIKTRLISGTLDSDDGADRRKPTTSYSSESQQQSQSVKGNTKMSSVKEKPPIIQESMVTHKSSAIQESSRKTEPSSSRKDSGNQSPRHVHPKLPDYDTLVQSLRKNRS